MYAPWTVAISGGYVRFPCILTTTLVRVGNLIALNKLYVTPFLNRIVAFVEKLPIAAIRAGTSSAPSVCGTVKVDQAEARDAKARSESEVDLIPASNDSGAEG